MAEDKLKREKKTLSIELEPLLVSADTPKWSRSKVSQRSEEKSESESESKRPTLAGLIPTDRPRGEGFARFTCANQSSRPTRSIELSLSLSLSIHSSALSVSPLSDQLNRAVEAS